MRLNADKTAHKYFNCNRIGYVRTPFSFYHTSHWIHFLSAHTFFHRMEHVKSHGTRYEMGNECWNQFHCNRKTNPWSQIIFPSKHKRMKISARTKALNRLNGRYWHTHTHTMHRITYAIWNKNKNNRHGRQNRITANNFMMMIKWYTIRWWYKNPERRWVSKLNESNWTVNPYSILMHTCAGSGMFGRTL